MTVKGEYSMDLAVIKVSQGKTAARVWMKFIVSQGSQSTVRALLSTQSPIEMIKQLVLNVGIAHIKKGFSTPSYINFLC